MKQERSKGRPLLKSRARGPLLFCNKKNPCYAVTTERRGMEFPFLQVLEDGWTAIYEELDNLLYNEVVSDVSLFKPWHEEEIYDGDWDVFGFYFQGEKLEKNCKLCPKTVELLNNVPGLTTAGFSALAPATYIKPHIGYTDTVWRAHLGLIVPPPIEAEVNGEATLLSTCGLKVGQEYYTWHAGRAFVFDDTLEHSAWNFGDRTRFVLLFDFLKE